MLKRAGLIIFISLAAAGWWCAPAARAAKSDSTLKLEIIIQSPASAPVTPAQLAKTRKIIAAQLGELQKSEEFQFTLQPKPPAKLFLKITGLRNAAEANLLHREAIPPRGKIEIYLLPNRYSLLSESQSDSITPKFIFLAQRSNMRPTPAKKVLQESKLIVPAEDFRPRPKIKVFSSPGKPDRWMITYTFLPEAGAHFSRFTKSHKGRNIALVIDGKIIAAPKIIRQVTEGQFILPLSSPLKEDSPEARRFKRDLNKRPLPLPVVVKEIREPS